MTAIQSEYSLWTRDPEPEVLPQCAERGIGFVPWSPLGAGYLTGKINVATAIDSNDFRAASPRIALRKDTTPAQIALAWLLAQRPYIVPVPSTTKLHRLEENIGAADVYLSHDDLTEMQTALAGLHAAGDRYAPANMAMAGIEAPEKA